MSQTRFDLEVEYEDGETVEVRAGQRECAAWERQPFGCSTTEAAKKSAVLFVRYLAYAALWRQRRVPKDDNGKTLGFDDWDRTVEEVRDVSPDEEEGVDPTKPDRSATSSSDSH